VISNFFAHPPWPWPPSFVLGVEVAFVVGDVLWRCVRVSIAAVFGAVFAAHRIAFPFLVCLVPPAAALLLTSAADSSLVGGGVGGREVDGDGEFCGVFLSILQRPLLLPLLRSLSLLLVIPYALSVSELSEERLGCCCTSWHRLSIPWLTISVVSPGAVALQ
jgi:hypothetical protein